MEILVNNIKSFFTADVLTVDELLKEKNFTFKLLVVKINGKLIKRTEYKTTTVHDGDNVAVIHMISGG